MRGPLGESRVTGDSSEENTANVQLHRHVICVAFVVGIVVEGKVEGPIFLRFPESRDERPVKDVAPPSSEQNIYNHLKLFKDL